MRIAFYAPMKPPDHKVPSGDRRVARLIMRALSRAGHQVVLASRLRSWDGSGDPANQARIQARANRTVERLARQWERDPARRPDLWFTYHLYHKAPDWIGPALARDFALPYAVAEASISPRRAEGSWATGYAQALAALRQAGAIFALTEKDRAGLARALGTEAPIHRLLPFVQTGPFARAARARAAARAHWWPDIPAGQPVLLAVGMMRPGDKQASYRVLAEAMARLAERDWSLVLVGYGPLAEEIRAWFPADRTRFVDRVALGDMPGLYAAADLFVWPAINEAFGMAILEAQAAGTPVVAGRTGGVGDIVDDGRSGLLAPPGDDAAFATAVADLLDDRDRRLTYGAAALARVSQRHSLEAASATLDPVIRALIA
jgi:glycosyltransferase involved in cell wall biosynthesis